MEISGIFPHCKNFPSNWFTILLFREKVNLAEFLQNIIVGDKFAYFHTVEDTVWKFGNFTWNQFLTSEFFMVSKTVKMVINWNLKIAFTYKLSGRKISQMPHCVLKAYQFKWPKVGYFSSAAAAIMSIFQRNCLLSVALHNAQIFYYLVAHYVTTLLHHRSIVNIVHGCSSIYIPIPHFSVKGYCSQVKAGLRRILQKY